MLPLCFVNHLLVKSLFFWFMGFFNMFVHLYFTLNKYNIIQSEVRGGPCNPSYWEDGI